MTSQSNNGLTLEKISFSYGAKSALDEVSLSLPPGTFCALLGPNGAGKSTLFALLTRLFTTRHGAIQIGGHDLNHSPRKALAQMGVVFQQTTLDLDLTIRQNLRYFAALQGFAGRDAARRIDAALDQLELTPRADEKCRSLNGGHKRRTEIARALLHSPRFLLLDEPTVGLDAATRANITNHVHDLARDQDLTILWATHLTDEVRDTDYLAILHQGRLRAKGTCAKLRGPDTLAEYFLNCTA